MLSLMAAAESLGSRSALLRMGASISADANSLSAERVVLIDEFKRREAELADLRAKLAAMQADRDYLYMEILRIDPSWTRPARSNCDATT